MVLTRTNTRCRLAAVVLLAARTVAQVSAAQRGPMANAPAGVQIVLLGTNDGPPIKVSRSEPSTVLIVDGRPYLIDCGIGTIRRLVRARIPSPTIRTIFFTHLHPDHALGLADLISNDVFALSRSSAAPTIDLYGPPETAALVDAALKYVGIPSGIFQAEGLRWTVDAAHFVPHEFSHAGMVYQDDKIRVVAAENSHYALMPEQFRARMKSFALRFETPYGVIVFTGDTGPDDAVTALARGADVLITEATVADSTPVAGVKKYFSGSVFAGADLQRYCLGGKTGNESGVAALHPCK